MFGILKRWRERRLRKRRELFTYFDGDKLVSIDPWPGYRRFVFHEHFEALGDEKLCQLAAEGVEPHCTNALTAICESFGLKRMDSDGEGMTDAEVFQFLSDLNFYLDGLKKKQSPGVTSPSATGEESWTPRESTTTSSHSDSGSYSPEQDIAEPVPSCEPST